MKNYKICLILIVIILFLSAFAFAENSPIKIVSKADKKFILIGERFNYTTTIYASPEVEVEFLEYEKTFGDFEIKEKDLSQIQRFGKDVYRLRYLLNIYKTGEHIIPAMEVKYREKDNTVWNSIKSNKIKIIVESIFTKTKITDDIKGVKPAMDRFAKLKFCSAITVAVLVIISILTIAISARRKFLERKRKTPIPAHRIAYAKLNNFDGKIKQYHGPIESLYAELLGILREYLQNRFSVKALGMTTEQISSTIGALRDLKDEQKGFLLEFFTNCDLIKFASYSCTMDKIKEYIESARKLIDETREEE